MSGTTFARLGARLLVAVSALAASCQSSSSGSSSPPPVTFVLSISSVRAAGGPEMIGQCVEIGRDSRGTLIVTVEGPPSGYLNASGACAANSACGYLVTTLTPARPEATVHTVRSSTTTLGLPLLESDAAQPELAGSYQLRVELRTPTHELALDTLGQPVVVELPIELTLPGGCSGGSATPGDGGTPEAGSGEPDAETPDAEVMGAQDAEVDSGLGGRGGATGV